MNKKSMILIATLALGVSTTSYSTSAQVSDNQSKVSQVNINKTVEKSSIEEQLEMLENAVVPTTPELTVETWANAVKSRNGALQFALFSDQVKAGSKQAFENSHWVTGVSSPWVETYRVISKKEQKDKSIEYKVEFDLYTSTGKAGKDRANISLVKIKDQWFINSIAPASEKEIGVWNTYESVNELNLNTSLKDMEIFNSQLGYSIHLPKNVLDQITIKDSKCNNEAGNPPCTFFNYKDKNKKEAVNLMTVIRLTEKQEKSTYYQEHPFLKKLTQNKNGAFYYMIPSEHPYAENGQSKEAQEWDDLLKILKERIQHITQ